MARTRSPAFLGFALAVLACFVGTLPSGPATAQETDEFARWMNLGKAHLENRSSAEAIKALLEAVKVEPDSASAHRNLARAYDLGRQFDSATKSLELARKHEADSVATSYLLGLVLIHQSKFAQGAAHLIEAVRLDPYTATLRYQLGSAFQATGKHDQAKQQFQETVRLDPFHASAQFKLASYARIAGDREEFRRRNREFMRLRQRGGVVARTPQMLERCSYTDPEAVPVKRAEATGQSDSPKVSVSFVDITSRSFDAETDWRLSAVSVLEARSDGRYTLVVVDGRGGLSLWEPTVSGKWSRRKIAIPIPATSSFLKCVVGDFHNVVEPGKPYDPKIHAKNDVLLLGEEGVLLFRRRSDGGFEDVTHDAGLAGVDARDAQWVDFDHDGDLDLLIGRKRGVELWQNNGNATFTNVTASTGISIQGAVVSVGVADLDENVAIDLLVALEGGPTHILINQRTGHFGPRPDPPGPWPLARQILLNDLNNDGHTDAILIGEKEGVIVYGGLPNRARLSWGRMKLSRAALLDYDNDGRLDLLVAGTVEGEPHVGRLRIWHNRAAATWEEASTSTGLRDLTLPPLTDLLVADLDGDGDTDILAVGSDQRPYFLRNDGGHRNGQLKIKLVSSKTNPSGLGTHVELRAADFWITRSVSTPIIELGLGGKTHFESVQVVWTNGVVDNQINVSVTGSPLEIVELNVAAGSCPFLYAWDGSGFRFVTDILGNSPVGLSITRGVFLPADVDEIVAIGNAASFPTREGQYIVEVTSEFREAIYLDYATLLAVDHPSDVEVHPTDKLMPPPFPPSEVWFLRAAKPLVRATRDDGRDETGVLKHIDGIYSEPGVPLPSPYRGMCHATVLTLDFGSLDTSRPLVLALTGWLQYGDASTNIAMSQNPSLSIIPPTLEVEVGPGKWSPIEITVGMPAGKTKTILCDLGGKLPEHAQRLRLTTTFEIRWDRIALFEKAPARTGRITQLTPSHARLYQRGFSEIKSRHPGHPTTPEYGKTSARPPWRTTPRGWCTRLGDVLDLLSERDNALVVTNGGEAITLRFDGDDLPPVPQDYERSFFFFSVGWDKDGDHNVAEGDTVDPMPFDSRIDAPLPSSSLFDWELIHNTRWVPGDVFSPRRTVESLSEPVEKR